MVYYVQFADGAIDVRSAAERRARQLHRNTVDVTDLLYALAAHKSVVFNKVWDAFTVRDELAGRDVRRVTPEKVNAVFGDVPSGVTHGGPATLRYSDVVVFTIFQIAMFEALALGDEKVGPQHLLLALTPNPDDTNTYGKSGDPQYGREEFHPWFSAFADLGVDPDELRAVLLEALRPHRAELASRRR